jgi:hypothetical protein
MNDLLPAVHRTVLVVDVEKFGDCRRTNRHKIVVRDCLYLALRQALENVGAVWEDCDHEDLGDGILVLIPPAVPKSVLIEFFPDYLVSALTVHNRTHCAAERIRLRVAIHAGELHYDSHGVVGRAVDLAFRLLDAPVLREALAGSDGVLALITSAWIYDEVVRHIRPGGQRVYRQVHVTLKETDANAWICLPDNQLTLTQNPPHVLKSEPSVVQRL